MRSLTAISYKIEDRLERQQTEAHTKILKEMYESNCLDTIHAIAHEQLGNTDRAQALRQWIATKRSRNLHK